jgi:hypothetical protein
VGSDGSEDDEDYWGDSIESNLGDNHRIYFQNIDGLRNNADESDYIHPAWLNSTLGRSAGLILVYPSLT